MSSSDTFQKFLLDDLNIRGEIVRLGNSFVDATKATAYPAEVRNLLGQTIAASLLLTGTLKFSGRLSIHARGEGPLSLLMAEATDKRTFRGLANWSEIPEAQKNLAELLGNAQLAITIDPEKGSRYQGIVPLEKEDLSMCLVHYFELSEQLDTHMILGADEAGAYGFMLQKLPGNGDVEDEDGWGRVIQLAKTLTLDELSVIDNETVLFRLFHEEKLITYDAEPVKFECTCSRQRTLSSIETFGSEEALEILEQQSFIAVDCQFCGVQYQFDRTDINKLFDLGQGH